MLKEYSKYIKEDIIINYYDFNFYIININFNEYTLFLNEHKKYNNKTWLYFKGIYYYCKFKYKKMLLLLNDIKESNIYTLLGRYYRCQKCDYYLMKKYYLMAIELGNSIAMRDLGYYYQYDEPNYYLMKKNYLMAIELGNLKAIHYLSYYYKDIEKNYDLMKKYYLIAIKLNDSCAMCKLAEYYKYIEKNYNLMKEYYLIAIEFNDSLAICYLKKYFKEIENNEANYYKYVYYPRILILILSINKQNRINKYKNKEHDNIFLPEEILTIVFNEYLLNI